MSLSLYTVILLAVLFGFIAGGIGMWMVGGARRRAHRRLRRHARDLEQSLSRQQITDAR